MSRRPLATLSVLGLGGVAIYYFALVRPFGIFRYYDTPGLDIGSLSDDGRTEGYLFLLLTAVLFGLCLGGLARGPVGTAEPRPWTDSWPGDLAGP